MFPAFKEWPAIIGALAAGAQIVILRKGGIAEGRDGFSVQASRFWLYPTTFHSQQDKIKPAAAWSWTEPGSKQISLTAYAEVQNSVFLSDWARVAALAPFHFWTEDTVRERFDWATPAGIHALVVRVHRLRRPIPYTPTPEVAGCRSWIELPFAFDDQPADPALDPGALAHRVRELGL